MGVKPFKSTPDLVSLLADDRGLAITDRSSAESTLQRVNYYRFTGYSRYFQDSPREGKNDYEPGADFDRIIGLMELDDVVRMRLFVALTDVEMHVRTRFAHVAGERYGEAAFYLDPTNHISVTAETSHRIKRVKVELQDSKQPMVARYRGADLDVSQVPIWVAVEVLSFGKISWLLESLDDNTVRERTADQLSFNRKIFPRTIKSLADLRNLCAHHGQLWNRTLTSQCPLPLNKKDRPRHLTYDHQSLYPAMIALRQLVRGKTAKRQLAAVERTLQRGDEYATGLLNPQGVR